MLNSVPLCVVLLVSTFVPFGYSATVPWGKNPLTETYSSYAVSLVYLLISDLLIIELDFIISKL